MATKDLGKISITPKGTWTIQTTGVEKNDIWKYGVSKYLALIDNPTIAPIDDGVNWYELSTAGESAYQEAVKLGYTGTEADWIQSLKQPAIDAAATATVAINQIDSRLSDKLDEVETALKETVDDAVATKAAKPLTISSDEVLAGSYNLDPNSGSIDIYEKTITLNNLPIIVGNTQEYVISDEPLGFGLFFNVDSFSVSSGKGLTKEFFQFNYQISRLYINDSMQSCIVIKCLNAPSEAVYGVLHIKYCKFLGDIIEFDVTTPNTVDKSAVNLEIPILKFNKKFLFSYINDDTYPIYQYIFSAINKRFIATSYKSNGDTDFFHHLMSEDLWNGYNPTDFLQCTDGAGVKRRFATSLACWSSRLDYVITSATGSGYPWTVKEELKLFFDFGFSFGFHDLEGYTSNTTTQDLFDTCLKNTASAFYNLVGRIPKLMIEPNGNHAYLTFSQNNPTIQVMTAQGGIPLIQKVYPFKSGFTLDKQTVAIQRHFYDSNNTDYPAYLLSELANFHSTADNSTIYWLIGSAHRSGKWETDMFTQINSLYGDKGDDSIWVPTLDEMFEYTFMRKGTIWIKTITDTGVHFKMYIPKMPNFFFRDISVLLSGISDITGISVTSGNNVYGTSYAINEGKLLVNLDFNSDLLSKVEKYVSDYEANYNANYKYDDAYYFVQKLKDGLRQPYLNRLNVYVSPPTFTGLTINSGATGTQNNNVTLAFTYTGQAPTYYMASENSDFSDASWLAYSPSVTFMLSSGYTYKTIYVKLKNPYGESGTLNSSIMYNEPTLALSSISISEGASTSNQAITIVPVFVGIPTQVMLSENSDFSGASWVNYTGGNINYNLSSGYGSKTLYVKLKNATTTTTVLYTSINYIDATSAILNGITINNGDAEPDNSTVSVAINTANTITKYKIGKLADLSDCPNWITWVSSPVSFVSGVSSGELTVYVKVGNDNSESDIKSDTITITPDVVLSAIVLNNGTSPLASLNVPVSFTITSGTPTYYRLAETADALNNAAWVAWTTEIAYTFASIGAKTLYGQVKNSVSTSQVFNSTITLTSPPVKMLLSFAGSTNNAVTTGTDKGDVINFIKPIIYSGYNSKQLVDSQGNILNGWLYNLNSSYYVANSIFVDNNAYGSVATAVANDGIYSSSTFVTCNTIAAPTDAPGTHKLRMSLQLPAGTYRCRLLYSTSSSMQMNESCRPHCYYGAFFGNTQLAKVNVSTTVGFTAYGNNQFNAEMTFTVPSDGTVDLAAWQDTTTVGYRPGVNLLEITKLS